MNRARLQPKSLESPMHVISLYIDSSLIRPAFLIPVPAAHAVFAHTLSSVHRFLLLPSVRCLSTEIEGNVSVLDHVSDRCDVRTALAASRDHLLYLSSHGQTKQNEEVHQQDRPVYGNVEDTGSGGEQGDKSGFGG